MVKRFALLTVAALLARPALAQSAPTPPGGLDPALLVAPPPAPGSAEESRELDEVRSIVVTASPAQKAQAIADDRDETPDIFDATIGPAFHARQSPATWALLLSVQSEADHMASLAKRHFGRLRPWGVDPTIARCDAAPGKKPMGSYPSGHAMLSYSVGLVLADLFPGKAPQILTRARDYAFERVVCGSHYLLDTEASHALASIVVTRLQATPDYAARFDAARRELAAGGQIAR